MSELTRQQLCAALGISESTVRRLEHIGLPFTPVGARSKRYDLAEVKHWLRENQGQLGPKQRDPWALKLSTAGQQYLTACSRSKLRVMPSN